MNMEPRKRRVNNSMSVISILLLLAVLLFAVCHKHSEKDSTCLPTHTTRQQNSHGRLPHGQRHIPSIAFRHHPPTLPQQVTPVIAWTLFVSAQLFTDTVSTLRKVWVLIRLSEQHIVSCPKIRPGFRMTAVPQQSRAHDRATSQVHSTSSF